MKHNWDFIGNTYAHSWYECTQCGMICNIIEVTLLHMGESECEPREMEEQ